MVCRSPVTISRRVSAAGIVHVRRVKSSRLLNFKNAYRILFGKFRRQKNGMGNNIGMSTRKMVYEDGRYANVAQDRDCGCYGICGVVYVGVTERS